MKLRILLDTETKKYQVYINESLRHHGDNGNNPSEINFFDTVSETPSVSRISFSGMNGEGQMYIDDITVRALDENPSEKEVVWLPVSRDYDGNPNADSNFEFAVGPYSVNRINYIQSEPVEDDDPIETPSDIPTDGGILRSVRINKSDLESEAATMLVAVYGSDGNLYSFASSSLDAEAPVGTVTVSCELSLPSENAADVTVKVFFWTSEQGQQAIVEAHEYRYN